MPAPHQPSRNPFNYVATQANPATCVPFLSFHHPGEIDRDEYQGIIFDIPAQELISGMPQTRPMGGNTSTTNRYMAHHTAKVAKLTSTFISSAALPTFGSLFPTATALQSVQLRWAVRDLGRLFQLQSIPQTVNPTVPNVAQFQDFLSSVTTSVPRALLRDTASPVNWSWSDRELCSQWRTYLYGTDQPTNMIGHEGGQYFYEGVLEGVTEMKGWLPLTAQTIATALAHTPRIPPGMVYSVAMNNLQSLSWYIKLVTMQYAALSTTEHYQTTLSLVIERFNQQPTTNQGLVTTPRYEQVYVNVHITSTPYTHPTDIASDVQNAINMACYGHQEKYEDESDTMAIIKSITTRPLGSAPQQSAQASNLIRTLPIRYTRHSLPDHIDAANLPANPFGHTVGLTRDQLRSPMTPGEIAAHTRTFFRQWLSTIRVHSRHSPLPVNYQALIEVYTIKTPEDQVFAHQCLGYVLLLYHEMNHLQIFEVEHQDQEYWEAQSFLPSSTQQKASNRQGSCFARVRDMISNDNIPNVSQEEFNTVFLEGNVLQGVILYFKAFAHEKEMYLLLLQGCKSTVKSLLVRVLNQGETIVEPVDQLPPHIKSVPTLFAGHAMIMNAESVKVFTRETVLPCYGAQSIMLHHNRRQFAKDVEYELAIPTLVKYAWTADQTRQALRRHTGLMLETPSQQKKQSKNVEEATKYVLSYDCETGTCDRCPKGTTHPIMVCLGINLTEILTFTGVQCPRRQTRGCYTQMITYLQKLSSYKDREYILIAHYGSKFDHQFLLQALLAMQVPVNVIKAKSKLQQIEFWNVKTVDTANIYPGSLQKVADMALMDASVRDLIGESYIHHGKYQAFPYGLLDMSYDLGHVDMEILSSDDGIWGGKRVKSSPELSIAAANTKYLRENFPSCITAEDKVDMYRLTQEYCEEDVRLLMTVAVMHYYGLIKKPLNNATVDLRGVITASSLAWRIFRGCFLQIKLPGRARGEDAYVGITLTTKWMKEPQRLKEADMVDHYIQGGLTTSNVRYIPPSKKGLKTLVLDINSSYPWCMTNELAYQYQRTTILPGNGVSLSTLLKEGRAKKTDWFLLHSADFRHAPFRERPYTVKFNGYNIGVDYTPMTWTDSRGNVQWHTRYGGELATYLPYENEHPMFVVKAIFHYEAAAMFREFSTSLYSMRLQAKAEGNVLMDALTKLLLNSTFGKTCQKEKERVMYMDTEEQLMAVASMDGGVTAMQHMQVPIPNMDDENNPIIRSIVQVHSTNSKLGPGEHAVIGSSILALARGRLAAMLIEKELKFKDEYGNPLLSPQGDTDSIIMQEPYLQTDAEREDWEKFQREHFDAKRLGAWKIEAEGDGAFYGAGKKNYCVTSIDTSTGNETILKMACKGAPTDLVKKRGVAHFKALIEGETQQITIPTSYRMDDNCTMLKTSIPRSLRAANITRVFDSDPSVWSTPYATLNDFLKSIYIAKGKDPAQLPAWRWSALPDEPQPNYPEIVIEFEC